MHEPRFCAICGFGGPDGLTSVIVQGQRFSFCAGHAAELRPTAPTTVAELEQRFGAVALERRAASARRLGLGRRSAPSADRRVSRGRRASD